MKPFLRRGLLIAVTLTTSTAFATELTTDEQKLGYLIGMDIGNSLKRESTQVDIDALLEAIRVTYEGGTPAMTEEEAQATREAFIAKRREAAEAESKAVGDKNAAEGAAFLAENATKDGVVVTDSGLQYMVVTQGDGAKPAATDTVEVHYRGTLLDGTEFDSSYARNAPISFALDRVIAGWTEGVQLMPVGSKYTFWIKPELAYGEAGGGPIPPNSTLKFEVELLSIETGEDEDL
jgi:FKBP-type peptidyl-prolyl cis-trans isomerase FkpA/FKBP-type peptidyl-prolyl cis-trans isomerase FklB